MQNASTASAPIAKTIFPFMPFVFWLDSVSIQPRKKNYINCFVENISPAKTAEVK
jgi:hypothetical protein